MGLAGRRGKVVVIHFWASWCAPCQETMAEMQTYREKHPDWGDLVVLLAVSIDDTKNAAENHLEKRGWNKTQNVWLDLPGGKNPDVLAHAANGVPAEYIIGPDGYLVDAGQPSVVLVNGDTGHSPCVTSNGGEKTRSFSPLPNCSPGVVPLRARPVTSVLAELTLGNRGCPL